jgi:acyl carrier protein phosphodiesterase
MNYLAHAFLSNNDKDLLIGNFIADHVRGNDFKLYNDKIIEGIRLHRKIDSFTDAHPLFRQSKRFFYGGFEKYSGILVDIYFDHLLASDFEKFAGTPLPVFSDQVYKVYLEHGSVLPKSSNRFLEYVLKNNVYSSYAQIEGIEKVLYHLSGRIGHNVRLDHSLDLFLRNETELRTGFSDFFNDAVKQFILNNSSEK